MDFVAIDFETTGYDSGGKNEPWQLGAAIVSDFKIIETREWFFGTLQPCYNKFRDDMGVLNENIHKELLSNSADFDAGFYRSIIPGVVSVGAGLILIMLLFYFIMTYYVNPIYKIAAGVNNYRLSNRKHAYEFDGDDQIADINTGVTELIEENIELKRRIKFLREDRL